MASEAVTQQPTPEEFLFVDLSSIAYPIWHTSQSEPNPNAASIRTVERVRALASGKPRVAICADSGKSFRADVDASYKANRPAQEETLRHQINLAIDTLRDDGFPVWMAKGFEADDVIATATVTALDRSGATVLIASSDKDLLALVGPRVSVKSARDGSILDDAAVFAKLGVHPWQVRDYLTLVGDSSDNIKGAKGIGPKKAAELLKNFADLHEVYQCIKDGSGRFQPATLAALQELEPRLETVRRLVSMRTDVPIPFEEILSDRVPKQTPFAQMTEPEEEEMDEPTIVLVDPAQEPPKTEPNGTVPAAPDGAPVALVRKPADVLPAPPEWERQLEPRSMREAMALADNLHASKLFSAYGAPQGVLATILAGRELGMQAVASLRAFHVIEGKPTLSADLIRALVIRSGKAKYFRCTERTPERATFETQRGDDPPVALSYSVEEGKLAWPKKDDQWLKPFMASGWGRNPADMCVARASAKLARLVYPDVVHGLYCFEEFDGQ